MMKIEIKVYTDGACSGNPGPGGWAALLLIKTSKDKETRNKLSIQGGDKYTTNNRMELIAAIESMKLIYKMDIPKNCKKDIRIFSDSAYVVDSISNGSLKKWRHNGWKTNRKTDVINRDLWEVAFELVKKINPRMVKVKGHSGDKFNEHVDKLAVEECSKFKEAVNN